MNPLLAQALGSIIRWALAFLAGTLVQAGIWTKDDAESYIAAAALAILGLGWSLWLHYRDRIKFLNALKAKPGTPESQILSPTLMAPRRGTGAGLMLLAFWLSAGALGVIGCGGNLPPNVTPAGKVSYHAKTVTDAAKTALGGIEVLTDQGFIPKTVTVQIARIMEKVGDGSIILADALKVYSDSKGAKGAAEVSQAIRSIQVLVTDAMILVPDSATREKVKAILQPVLNALADALAGWTGPPLPTPLPAAKVPGAGLLAPVVSF